MRAIADPRASGVRRPAPLDPARVLFDSHRVSRIGDDASMIDDDAGVPESSSFACDASFGATRREGLISRSMSVRYKTTADVALRRRRR